MKQQRILYICTGNIYRSRYAEAFTNYTASTRGLAVTAASRGLAVHLVDDCTSPYVLERLRSKGIAAEFMSPCKRKLEEEDLHAADFIVALKESEHRPMMATLFPRWVDRIRYWNVSDVGEWKPQAALDTIESLVLDLLEDIS